MKSEAYDLITRRIERRIKESKLPERKLLSYFDFDFQTGIDKKQIMGLATLDFSRHKSVRRKQGIILAGNSGTGKSHIKALLFIGCQQAYRCRYSKDSDMLKHLMSGLPDDTLDQKFKTYIQPDILLSGSVWRKAQGKISAVFMSKNPNPHKMILCESAIDALSFFSMNQDWICVSTSGANPNPNPAWLPLFIANGFEIHCGFDAGKKKGENRSLFPLSYNLTSANRYFSIH